MLFDTNSFYQYVFSDINDKMEIEVVDKLDVSDKATKRVYDIISEITNEVIERLNKKCLEDYYKRNGCNLSKSALQSYE